MALAESLLAHYRGKSAFNTCQLTIIAAHASLASGDTMLCHKYLCEAEQLMRDKTVKERIKRRELWDTYKELIDDSEFAGDCQ